MAGDLDRASERPHDPVRERETEPGAVAGPGCIGAEERIEDVRQVGLGDPLAGVVDHQSQGIWITAPLEVDRPVGGGMADGVHEEVLKHPAHAW